MVGPNNVIANHRVERGGHPVHIPETLLATAD
jgi:hypothetical protein